MEAKPQFGSWHLKNCEKRRRRLCPEMFLIRCLPNFDIQNEVSMQRFMKITSFLSFQEVITNTLVLLNRREVVVV